MTPQDARPGTERRCIGRRSPKTASLLRRAAFVAVLTMVLPLSGETTATPAAPQAAGPSLLLVTIDTWRWDYIGASGAGKVETPNLDRLAREGVYEPEAVTPCPLTTPAHASLFTGMDIFHHVVLDCTVHRLDKGPETLAEALRTKGLRTAAFVAGETLKRRYGLDRGFDLYDDSGLENRRRGDWMSAGRDGTAVTEAVLAHIKAQGVTAPLFVWAHYFDLHLPYRARPGLDALYPRDPYAAQAVFVDGEVGRLRSAIEADKGRSWRIIIVGDHGEGLGERNEDTHGMGLYRATLHVPLIVWPKPTGPLVHPRPWGLVDLLPTVRTWFDLPPGKREDGESLFREGRRDRWLTAVTVEPTLMFGVAPFKGIRRGGYQYFRDGTEELYDLSSDPGQTRDLSAKPEFRSELRRLRSLCDKAWPRNWPSSGPASPIPLTDEEQKRLQSLGYVSGAIPSGRTLLHAPIGKVLLDRSLWDRAREEAFKTRRAERLTILLARLVSDYPFSASLRREYGILLYQSGDLKEAIRQMEDAVRQDPRDGAALTNLGGFYLQDGRVGPAETFLNKALTLDPKNSTAHKNLGILHADHRKDPVRAAKHYRECLRLDPDSPDAPAIKAYLADHPDLP